MRKSFQFAAIVLLLVIVPLLKGGNSEWVRALLIGVVVMFAWLSMLMPENKMSQVPADSWPWWMVWWVFTGWIGVQFLIQMLTGLVDSVSPKLFGLFMPLEALAYWALFSAYWLLAWMVAQQPAKAIRAIVIVIVVVAVFQAMYGLVAFVGKDPTIFGIWERNSIIDTTGSFINRNHFAGFLALSLPIGLSFFYGRHDFDLFDKHPLFKNGLAVIFMTVLLIAILGSHSRLGMFVAMISVALWAYLCLVRPSKTLKHSRLFVGLIALVVVFGLIWFGAGGLIGRLMNANIDARAEAWSAMFSMPLSTWLFGVGAGGFADMFGTIVKWDVQGSVYYEAHNDYLEFVFDFGLIGAGLIFAALLVWFKRLKVKRWSLIQYGALCGIMATAIHALGDFSLQIPGVAVLFWIAVGILMNPNVSQKAIDRRKRVQSHSGRRRVRRSAH